jgi:starvation-inducible outer membrane lipoprotein
MRGFICPTRPQKRLLDVIACVAIAAHLAGCVGIARSQTRNTPAEKAVRQACAADYRSLCSGVRPGGGEIAACFKQHASELSQPCRSALQAAQAAKQSQQ